MSDEKKYIPRCPQCAFVNPDDALHCAMCGTELPRQYPKYPTRKDKGQNYEKAVIRGTMERSAGYGTAVWQREMLRVIGLTIVAALTLFLPFVITGNATMSPTAKFVWLFFDLFLMCMVIGGSIRGYLNIIRDSRLDFGNVFIEGIMNSFRVMFVLIPAMIFLAIMGYLIYTCAMTLDILDTSTPFLGEDLPAVMALIMIAALAVFLVMPTYVWLNVYTVLVVCRTLDRRSSIFQAVVWTFRKIFRYHWPLMKVGMGQVVANFIGLAICGIGLFATFPLSTIQIVCVYEWLRMHGPDSDDY